MTVTLYKTSSQRNKVTKDLTSALQLSEVKLKGECSIEKPRLMLTGVTDFTYNYLYIPNYNRYYYINDYTIVTNNLVMIDCEVDVLMSFKDSILANKGTIERNASVYNSMFIDSTLTSTIDDNVRTIKFPEQPFEFVNYIINFIG